MENIMNNRVYYYVVNLDNYDFNEFGFYTYNGEDGAYVSVPIIGVSEREEADYVVELITGRKIYKKEDEVEKELTFSELRKATCSELTKTSKIIDYINKGYDIKAKMNSKLDEIERISQERYEEYMSSLDSIYDYYRKLEL